MSRSDNWAQMLQWSGLISKDVDLDEEEREYKIDVAERLSSVRQSVLINNPGWQDDFRRALASSNLLNQFLLMPLIENLREQTDAMREAILVIWTPEPEPALLDAFATALGSVGGHTFAPGNRLALGALLLMARDPARFPPFRARAVKRWLGLVGRVAPKPSSAPSVRYGALLSFLDELVCRAQQSDLPIHDRLDAQGLAWTLTQEPPPEDWPAEQVQAFLQWRGDAPKEPEPVDAGRRAWLVRPGSGSGSTVSDWRSHGFVSLAASHLGDVTPGSDLPTVRSAVDKGYQHLDYSQRLAVGAEYYNFLTMMKPDDVVVTSLNQQVSVGTILDDPTYTSDQKSRLRRSVAWSTSDHPAEFLSAPIPGLLDLQGTVVDLTAGLDVLLPLLGPDEAESHPETGKAPDVTVKMRATTPELPAATDALAGRVHMPRRYLQELIELLRARHQIVLYGPPGTGKTFLAQALAEHIVGTNDPSRAQLVQFHPAYAYEDFFEGFRPVVTTAGQAAFQVLPGPLRRIASAAHDPDNQGSPFVLIIDEMNRANLAKVFGELYFLLEYRNKYVQLQYNPGEPFQLPANLFMIGTMNTADRSIAMVDAAIRRRFPFVELHPDVPPVQGVLQSFLTANHKTDNRAQLLAALNAQIDESDRDMRIGPSYLMRSDAETRAGLERIWKYDILPLLEEHYYGRLSPTQVRARFGLTNLLGQFAAIPVHGEGVLAEPGEADSVGDSGVG